MSLADEILAIEDDFTYEEVVIPEWGNRKLLVRGISQHEAKKIELEGKRIKRASSNGNASLDDATINLITLAFAVLDPENKQPVFTVDQMRKLADRSTIPIQRLLRAMVRCGDLDSLERTKKNSELTETFDSDSILPVN